MSLTRPSRLIKSSCKPCNASLNHDAVFSQQSTNLVHFGGSLANQFSAYPMYGLYILLFKRFDGNKAHLCPLGYVGTGNGFTNRFGVIGIIFVAFHVGLYKLGCHQFNGMA
jgi:hypothetical protein